MHFETPHFAIDVPDGYQQQEVDTCSSFVHGDDHREITVATIAAKEEADIGQVLRGLADARLDILRKEDAAAHSSPVTCVDRGELRESSFVAVGREPLLTFCGSVVDRRPLMGQRHVVMFCCDQYFKRGAGAPDVSDTGPRYNANAAAQAWAKVNDWFRTHVG